MKHTIKYYPVGNADCSLIKLSDGKTIIVDCQFLSDLNDDKGKQVFFDVKKDLLKELKKDTKGHPYVDLFINTHPHKDHCLGFAENFYHGVPENYDEKNDVDKIIIGELWVTPRSFSNDVCEQAKELRKEAKRRRSLYDNDQEYSGVYGNYLRIVGYDEDKEFDSRYGYVPGTTVKKVNGNNLSWLNIFIHAPFKEDVNTSKEDNDKNVVSIVVQFAFFIEGYNSPKCKVLMGGDAEHEVWQHILDKNSDDKNLEWNIFLAPHHCSWTFFNESSNKDEIVSSATDILNLQIGNKAFIVASSNDIKDDDNNPPCYKAKQEYKKQLKTKDNFVNTTVDHNENSVPQPIVFYIDEYGKRKEEFNSNIAGASTYTRPAPRAGKE
jgi:hypothetical protein